MIVLNQCIVAIRFRVWEAIHLPLHCGLCPMECMSFSPRLSNEEESTKHSFFGCRSPSKRNNWCRRISSTLRSSGPLTFPADIFFCAIGSVRDVNPRISEWTVRRSFVYRCIARRSTSSGNEFCQIVEGEVFKIFNWVGAIRRRIVCDWWGVLWNDTAILSSERRRNSVCYF